MKVSAKDFDTMLEDLAVLAQRSDFLFSDTAEKRESISAAYRELQRENEELLKHIREHAPGTLPSTHKESTP